jgi:hypothetical protein
VHAYAQPAGACAVKIKKKKFEYQTLARRSATGLSALWAGSVSCLSSQGSRANMAWKESTCTWCLEPRLQCLRCPLIRCCVHLFRPCCMHRLRTQPIAANQALTLSLFRVCCQIRHQHQATARTNATMSCTRQQTSTNQNLARQPPAAGPYAQCPFRIEHTMQALELPFASSKEQALRRATQRHVATIPQDSYTTRQLRLE